jgi:hypothetical protein
MFGASANFVGICISSCKVATKSLVINTSAPKKPAEHLTHLHNQQHGQIQFHKRK